ncbi:MFS transporter, OPA family, solute carrier family 37 (glycerol-6-phosphate transporter), member 4 [Paragonimus westermani]|uniref:MFS transporter, OPA family, solute carrier family 37 (Glycerol-6-phosphate transporter), member 4 n=1 Tax=Paragonimus westermani TaxID=34504 RepID=A0A5J4NJK4_9TREM|nr:MFS transporter, OPA family, solute carrier family 37 (glycerol-6-phosphate transporter), member 4 [Paragonimus westermani]
MPSDKRRPLLILASLFISYTCLSLARRVLQDVYTLMPSFVDDKQTTARLGLILSSQTAGYTITKLLSGIAMDRMNPMMAFVFALWGTTLSLLLMSISSHFYSWFILYSFNGLFLGVSWPAIAKILRTSVSQHELATWWGILASAVNLAGGLGPWIALSLMSSTRNWLGNDAWKSVFITLGCGCLLSGILLMPHRLTQPSCRPHNQNQIDHQVSVISHTSFSSSVGLLGQSVSMRAKSADKCSTNVGHLKADHSDQFSTNQQDSLGYSCHLADRSNTFWQQLLNLVQVLSPRHRLLLCCSALVHLSSTFLRFAISNWFLIMLKNYPDLYSLESRNSFVTTFELGGLLGNLLAGLLSDQGVITKSGFFSNPRMSLIVGQMVPASILLMVVSIFIEHGIPSLLLILTGLILGLTVFGAISLCGVFAVELAPPSLSGTCHAFSSLCANLGALLACYPFTWLVEQVGWSTAFSLSGLLSGLTILPLLLVSIAPIFVRSDSR